MVTHIEILEAEALKLGAADRARLLQSLIASLDVDSSVEHAWEVEADRREALLQSGSVREVSSVEAMQRLQARLHE